MRLPKRALTNIDIEFHSRNIPYFRGVFMRNQLPNKPLRKECGVINLDHSSNPGTHWVAYAKCNNFIEYFDSFGNLKPPGEFVKYVGHDIKYNYKKFQDYNSYRCGHLCLKFLHTFWQDRLNK